MICKVGQNDKDKLSDVRAFIDLNRTRFHIRIGEIDGMRQGTDEKPRQETNICVTFK